MTFKIGLILLLLSVHTGIAVGQFRFTNFYDDIIESDYGLDSITKDLLDKALINYFSENIEVNDNNETNALLEYLEMNLKSIIDSISYMKVENLLSNGIYSYQIRRYYSIEENGLSVAENDTRWSLIQSYDLYRMSETGKNVFFENFPIIGKIYRKEGATDSTRLLLEEIREQSNIFFDTLLEVNDKQILDRYWLYRIISFEKSMIEKDSFFKVRHAIILRNLDSLEELYLPIIQREAGLVLQTLSQNDLQVLDTLNVDFQKILEMRRDRTHIWEMRHSFRWAPSVLAYLMEGYNIMSKYPSMNYALRHNHYPFRFWSLFDRYKKGDSYAYIEFEKSLNKVIQRYAPRSVMPFYSYENEYDAKTLRLSYVNMLLYYLKNNR